MRSSMAGPLALSSRRQLLVVSRRLELVARVVRVVPVAWLVAGQDLVHLPPGPLQELLGRADLVRRAGVGQLHDAAAEPGRLREQAGHLAGLVRRHRLPGRPGPVGVFLDVLPPGLGQAERAPATGLLTGDQPFVGQQLQGRGDRAGAGPPGAAAALLDLGHDLVTVARAFAQQGQDGRAHVATAGFRPALRGRRAGPPAPRSPEAGSPEAGRARAPRTAGARPSEGPLPRGATPPGPGAATPGLLMFLALLARAGHAVHGLPGLVGQVLRGLEQAAQVRVEVSARTRCRTHPGPSMIYSRYDPDISPL